MTQVVKIGTDTTGISPSGDELIALYPDKEHVTVDDLSTKIRNDITS